MSSQDRLMSDEDLAEKLATLIVAFNMNHSEKSKEDIDKVKGKYMMPTMLKVINTQKRLYAESVIGEDVDINEIKIGRIKNIKGDRKGADVKAFDWSIEVETWKNQLRAEQRNRLNDTK